ncbi:MAG TPA: shikimate dehydrogenase [Hyphomonas sp.]|nr:shikimate dehydrogenase [Hyphomonas sp.]HRX74332.1 shikimate dehydrogenase [Hyphomonas sp.]
MTYLLGVIGDPVSHSLSPVIHNMWIREHGLDASYEALRVERGDLGPALATLSERNALGFNITLPHKEDALALADEASDIARRIGAANTLIRREDGGWRAENTDAPGFVRSLMDAGIDVAGCRVTLLGAGGSARAVAISLTDLRADITIANRTRERAETLVRETGITADICSLEEGIATAATADLVVNTLSLGHSGESLVLPKASGQYFYDISYGKAAAATQKEALAKDWRPLDGLPMLVAQAAYSFEHWFGILPGTAEALERCRRLVEATA